MRKALLALITTASMSLAQQGYQVQDLSKFLRGTDGQTKSIRSIHTYQTDLKLEKVGTGRYDITMHGWKVAERQDINLGDLGELRTIRITDKQVFGDQNYGKTFATLHMTREQRRAFRENPEAYAQKLNEQLAQYGYRVEVKYINQKDPKTGAYRQVPKPVLVRTTP